VIVADDLTNAIWRITRDAAEPRPASAESDPAADS